MKVTVSNYRGSELAKPGCSARQAALARKAEGVGRLAGAHRAAAQLNHAFCTPRAKSVDWSLPRSPSVPRVCRVAAHLCLSPPRCFPIALTDPKTEVWLLDRVTHLDFAPPAFISRSADRHSEVTTRSAGAAGDSRSHHGFRRPPSRLGSVQLVASATTPLYRALLGLTQRCEASRHKVRLAPNRLHRLWTGQHCF